MHHQVIVIFCVLVVNTICQVSAEQSDELGDDYDGNIEGRDVIKWTWRERCPSANFQNKINIFCATSLSGTEEKSRIVR